jgi:hypothetical protein
LYAIEDFDEIRMNAMISVTIHYPKESAIYLTSKFYEAGFTISQRNDILDVLVISVQKLSSPNEEPIFERRVLKNQKPNDSNLLTFISNQSSSDSNWREIVRKRIESKTSFKKVQH